MAMQNQKQFPLLLILSLAMMITLVVSFVRFAVHSKLSFYYSEKSIPDTLAEKINEVKEKGI
jgi:cytochrome c-type biogenesis protein CcmE